MLQPVVQLLCQGHGVGRHHKASYVLAQEQGDFLGKQGRPQALDGRQCAQELAFPGPGRTLVGELVPERMLALCSGNMQFGAICREPLGFSAQGATPAVLGCLTEGAQGLAGSQGAFGQIMHGRVQDARIGCEKSAGLAIGLLQLQFLLEQLPGPCVQEATGIAVPGVEEGAHGSRKLGGVQTCLPLRIGDADQGEGHGDPVHFRKVLELFAHLLMAIQFRISFHAGSIQQACQGFLSQCLQPVAHVLFYRRSQCRGLTGRHNGYKAVGQCRCKQGVAVGATAIPFAVREELFGYALFAQPQIHLWYTTQAREQDGIWPQLLADHAHGLPRQACQQVRACP